ncbi:MAG TPA: histone [Thermofilum sp.]|nr:histone [Thermofilum sp.]
MPRNRGEIAIAPIARILKQEGAERVSDEAATYLRNILEEIARYIAREAVSLTKYSNRKTVTRRDIEYVVKRMYRQEIASLLREGL